MRTEPFVVPTRYSTWYQGWTVSCSYLNTMGQAGGGTTACGSLPLVPGTPQRLRPGGAPPAPLVVLGVGWPHGTQLLVNLTGGWWPV